MDALSQRTGHSLGQYKFTLPGNPQKIFLTVEHYGCQATTLRKLARLVFRLALHWFHCRQGNRAFFAYHGAPSYFGFGLPSDMQGGYRFILTELLR